MLLRIYGQRQGCPDWFICTMPPGYDLQDFKAMKDEYDHDKVYNGYPEYEVSFWSSTH